MPDAAPKTNSANSLLLLLLGGAVVGGIAYAIVQKKKAEAVTPPLAEQAGNAPEPAGGNDTFTDGGGIPATPATPQLFAPASSMTPMTAQAPPTPVATPADVPVTTVVLPVKGSNRGRPIRPNRPIPSPLPPTPPLVLGQPTGMVNKVAKPRGKPPLTAGSGSRDVFVPVPVK